MANRLADQLLRATLSRRSATWVTKPSPPRRGAASRRSKATAPRSTGRLKTTWLGIVATQCGRAATGTTCATLARQSKSDASNSRSTSGCSATRRTKLLARKALDLALTDEVGPTNAAGDHQGVSNELLGNGIRLRAWSTARRCSSWSTIRPSPRSSPALPAARTIRPCSTSWRTLARGNARSGKAAGHQGDRLAQAAAGDAPADAGAGRCLARRHATK